MVYITLQQRTLRGKEEWCGVKAFVLGCTTIIVRQYVCPEKLGPFLYQHQMDTRYSYQTIPTFISGPSGIRSPHTNVLPTSDQSALGTGTSLQRCLAKT